MAWIGDGRLRRWRFASALAAGLVVVAAVPASAAGGWRKPGPANPNARLNAVSCVSVTVCAAVGSLGNYSPTFKTYAECNSDAVAASMREVRKVCDPLNTANGISP